MNKADSLTDSRPRCSTATFPAGATCLRRAADRRRYSERPGCDRERGFGKVWPMNSHQII